MSSYKDKMSDESVPMAAMFVTAFIGVILGIYYLNQQWKFLDETTSPVGFMITVAAVGALLGIVAIVKGHSIFGSMPLVVSLFVFSTLLNARMGVGEDLTLIGLAAMFAILAIACFIGGEFNSLVSNVCFAVAMVLMISMIDFEYQEAITGVFFIVAGGAALYSALLNWNTLMGRSTRAPEPRARRKDDDFDDLDDIDDVDDVDDQNDDDFDDYDDYDRPRRRRSRS